MSGRGAARMMRGLPGDAAAPSPFFDQKDQT